MAMNRTLGLAGSLVDSAAEAGFGQVLIVKTARALAIGIFQSASFIYF